MLGNECDEYLGTDYDNVESYRVVAHLSKHGEPMKCCSTHPSPANGLDKENGGEKKGAAREGQENG